MKIFRIIILLLMTIPAIAQQKSELGLFFGTALYQGDLTEPTLVPSEIKLAFGGVFRYQFNTQFAGRVNFFSGRITGDDAHNTSLASRGFKFKTNLLELGFTAEWMPIATFNQYFPDDPKFNFYLFGGPGVTYGKSEVTVTKEEDKSKFPEVNDRSVFFHVSLGTGARFRVSDLTNIGLELGWRTVFSDYLDGVSINGRPDKNDWYLFGGILVLINLNNQEDF